MNDHITGEDLAAYVDGILQGAPQAEIESHLSCCPECLAALAEIVDIQGSAVKIPEEFLRRALQATIEVPEGSRRGSVLKVPAEGALGEKPSPAKVVPPMRLVFGIAAVFLVAVLIGYYFLDRGRRETAVIGEKEMPRPVVSAKDYRSLAPAAGTGKARKETVERTLPAQEAQAEAANGWRMEKKSVAGAAQAVQPVAPPEGKMVEPAPLLEKAERPQAADAKDMALPREAEGSAVGGVLGGVEAPMDKDKENAGKLAVASVVPSKGAAIEERMAPRSRVPGSRVVADAMQLFLAVTGHAAAPPAVEIMGPAKRPAMRIAGDVSRADLSDPGLLDSWTWFPAGLALELGIDAAGMVVAVVPVGPWDGQAAARAETAARELRFPASGRKSRRAVLSRFVPPN